MRSFGHSTWDSLRNAKDLFWIVTLLLLPIAAVSKAVAFMIAHRHP